MTQVTYISSQEYRSDDVIAAKLEAEDYTVYVSPSFEVGGNLVSVVIDGHHSHSAAIEAGVEPEYVTLDVSSDDRLALLDKSADAYLEVAHLGDDWRDINTGSLAF